MKRLERLSYYEVEAIVDSKVDELGNTMYLVKWKNWPPETNTWEPIKHLSTVRSLIKEFHDNNNIPAITGEVVKRKRGRPKLNRQPAIMQAKPQALVEPTNKGEQLASIVEQNTHPVIESVSDEPAIKLEEVQVHKDSKRKPIHKLHRATPKAASLPFSQQEKEQQEEGEKEKEKEKQKECLRCEIVSQKREENEQMGLQWVLLHCLNYTEVKVSFKDRTFYYQIPFLCDDKQQSVTVTASEIIKVNQRWFQGFFEGFYL